MMHPYFEPRQAEVKEARKRLEATAVDMVVDYGKARSDNEIIPLAQQLQAVGVAINHMRKAFSVMEHVRQRWAEGREG